MAKTIVVKITCDRCKAEGAAEDVDGDESVSFSYDGYTYGLDLCRAHAEDFHATIQGLIGVSTSRERVGGGLRRVAAAAPSAPAPTRNPARRDREQLNAIRDWANSHGYTVSNRGRIPAEVEEAYQASFQRKSEAS